MITISQALSFLAYFFHLHQFALPAKEAEYLLCDLFSYSRAELYQNFSCFLTRDQWKKCLSWLRQRLKGVPLEYLCGKVEFYGTIIEVDNRVLIPRPETEILVDKVVQFLKGEPLKKRLLWDLCCGSGCIAIALKKIFPQLQLLASDLSKDALEVAKKNCHKNSVEVALYQGDLLAAGQGQKVHYLICNPPYIPFAEYQMVGQEVTAYEPHEALFAGNNGLEFYQRLAAQLPLHLFRGGRVWLEMGYNQGKAITQLFDNTLWQDQKVEKDWAGHDRFFYCQLK